MTRKRSREYSTWHGMLYRCYNPNAVQYARYGGRGIDVCERWRNSFANFLEDMGPKPPKSTIERIDNMRGYSTDNCRWASYGENNRNKRNNLRYTYKNETKTVVEWSEKFSIPYNTLRGRLLNGQTIDKAIQEILTSRDVAAMPSENGPPHIRALRKASRLLGSDGELSRRLGRNPATICRWLSGKVEAIPFDVPFAVHRLTEGEVDAWDFVDRNNEASQPTNTP